MTRKDYILLAGALNAARSFAGDVIPWSESRVAGYVDACDRAAEIVADVLSADNPRFSRSTFLDAVRTGNLTQRPKRV